MWARFFQQNLLFNFRKRTGPPDGGPARVAPTGWVAAGGAWQTNDAANRRISRRIGGDGPAGASTTAGSR